MTEKKKHVFKASDPALHFGRVGPYTHKQRTWYADIPAGTDIDAIMNPIYWRHYTQHIGAGDIVEAVCEDGLWEASFRVRFVSKTEVRLALRSMVDYDVTDEDLPEEALADATHKVVWKGPHMKFAVVHVDTGEILEKGFEKDEAHRWLSNYLGRSKAA